MRTKNKRERKRERQLKVCLYLHIDIHTDGCPTWLHEGGEGTKAHKFVARLERIGRKKITGQRKEYNTQ